MTKSKEEKDVSRYQCFTINNPTTVDDQQLADMFTSGYATYICFGREHWKENDCDVPVGTPHYQGYAELSKSIRFANLKKQLPRAHFETRKGSRTQARDYCFKEDPNPTELGEWKPDRAGQRNDLVCVKRKLMDPTADLAEIATDHFESFCRYHKFFTKFRDMHTMSRDEPTEVCVYFGPTGSGKTRKAFSFPKSIQMDYINGFFEDPGDAETIIFDDIKRPIHLDRDCPGLFSRRMFLRICDRYPMRVNIKGGSAEWKPKRIIFTTNSDPHSWDLDDACRRRITKFVEFPLGVETPPVRRSKRRKGEGGTTVLQ